MPLTAHGSAYRGAFSLRSSQISARGNWTCEKCPLNLICVIAAISTRVLWSQPRRTHRAIEPGENCNGIPVIFSAPEAIQFSVRLIEFSRCLCRPYLHADTCMDISLRIAASVPPCTVILIFIIRIRLRSRWDFKVVPSGVCVEANTHVNQLVTRPRDFLVRTIFIKSGQSFRAIHLT